MQSTVQTSPVFRHWSLLKPCSWHKVQNCLLHIYEPHRPLWNSKLFQKTNWKIKLNIWPKWLCITLQTDISTFSFHPFPPSFSKQTNSNLRKRWEKYKAWSTICSQNCTTWGGPSWESISWLTAGSAPPKPLHDRGDTRTAWSHCHLLPQFVILALSPLEKWQITFFSPCPLLIIQHFHISSGEPGG